MDQKEFRIYMLKNDDTNNSLAEYLGCSETTISNKRTGKTEWTQGEMVALKNRWNLSPDEVDKIFFDK